MSLETIDAKTPVKETYHCLPRRTEYASLCGFDLEKRVGVNRLFSNLILIIESDIDMLCYVHMYICLCWPFLQGNGAKQGTITDNGKPKRKTPFFLIFLFVIRR